MRPTSILIKSIDGNIYKITDLFKGKKIPLTEVDLKDYDMHPISGVYKDLNGALIDISEIYANSGNIQISDNLPEDLKPNSLYVDKNAKAIYVYDDEIGLITLGNGENSITYENSLTDDEVKDIISIFKNLNLQLKKQRSKQTW